MPSPETSRDPHLDNAKGLLMILVLTGHMIWPVPSPDRITATLYAFIYTFHMPLFALISGYLSHARFEPRRLGREVVRILVPYTVFVLLQWLLLRALDLPTLPLTQGHFGLWFLLSLFCWRALLPLLAPLPGARAMLLSVAVALACGYLPFIDLDFSLSRSLVFMPCFLAGHLLRRTGVPLSKLRHPGRGGLVLAGLLLAAMFLAARNLHPLLYSAHSYQVLGMDPAWAPLVRLARLGLALLGGMAVLAVTPARACLLTDMGRRSLFIYLLHGPLLVVYRAFPALFDPLGRLWFLILPISLILAWLLSRRVVARVTSPLVTPLALLSARSESHSQ